MTASDIDIESPSSLLLLRRGWFDPVFYLVTFGVARLIYVAIDPTRDEQLEQAIGYTGTRIALITFLTMFVWGTVQGLRGRMVVYINDEVTPGFNDTTATFVIVAGTPLIIFSLWFLATLLAHLLLPTGVTPPKFDDGAAILLFVAWSIGILWLYARLYAYNRGALSALTALVTKLGWCLFALGALHNAGKSFTNEDNKSFGEAAGNVIYFLLLFVVALEMMVRLTYEGPSLRQRQN